MQLDLEQEHLLYLTQKAARRRFLIYSAVIAMPLAAAIYFFIYYEPAVNVQEHFDSAQQHYKEGDIRAAAIELKNVLKTNPEDTAARFLLGKIYLELELGTQAEKELIRSSSKQTDLRQLNRMLAQAQLLQGKPKKALETLESTTEGPDQFSFSENLLFGQAYYDLREWANATDSYNQALSQRPDSVDAVVGLGRVAFSKGDTAIATQYAAQLEDSVHDNWKAWSLKGDIARSEGQLTRAKKAYETAFNLKSNALEPRLFHALIAIGEKNFDEAAQDATSLLRNNPRHPGGHYIQGQIHFSKQEFTLAQTSFELAIRFTNYPPATRQLGITHFQLGNYALAETYLEEYFKLAPYDTEIQKLLSAIYIQQNKLEDAKITLESIASTATDNEALQRLIAELERATGESDKSTEILNQILDKNPESFEARFQLGQTLLTQGKVHLALEELIQADEQNPSSTNAKLLIIKAHLQLKQYETALAIAGQLKLLEPENPQFSSLDGIIYLASGDQKKAVASFTKTQREYPGDILSGHQLGLITIRSQQYEDAKKYYLQILAHHKNHLQSQIQIGLIESAAQHPELAKKTLLDAIHNHPENPRPKLILAHIYLLNDEPKKAIVWLQQIKKDMAPSPQYLSTLTRAYMQDAQFVLALDTIVKLNEVQPSPESYWLEAKIHFRQQDIKGARTALEHAQKLAPNTTRFDDALFEILIIETETAIQRVNYYVARENLAEIKKNENPMPYLVLRARLDESKGNYVDAIKHYQQAQDLKPQTKILASLLRVLSLSGQITQAETVATKWLHQHPDDYQIIYQLANAQLVEGHTEKAIKNYEKLLNVAPDDIVILNNLAFLYTDIDLEQAAKYAEKAYTISPENAAVADTCGWINLQQGQDRKALNLLRKAYSLDPSVPGIQYHLASALAKNGKTPDAIRLLRGLSRDTFREKSEANALLYTLESVQE
ncbi:MAG: PEP-CTERM system TPR-repeat protein PrsT [Pseudomonadales bacterium]|nr:PEP-CTERM system TPR-repeat protein PrsT [Pseudomonadales bacterium]